MVNFLTNTQFEGVKRIKFLIHIFVIDSNHFDET